MHAILEEFLIHNADLRLLLKVHKDCTKVNVMHTQDFGVKNTPVRLRHEACNSWRVITSKWQFDHRLNV